MPTEEEAAQIEREMKAAGMSDDDVVRFLASELEREQGAPPTLGSPASQGLETTKKIAKFGAETLIFGGLGRVGEALGSMALRRAAPVLGKFLGRTIGFGAADLAIQAAEKPKDEPLSFRQAASSAVIGKGTETLLGGLGRGLVRAGKVPKEVVSETMAQTTLKRGGEMFGAVPESAHLAEAERVGGGVKEALRNKSAGRRNAERMIRVADQMQGPGAVDSQPIKDHILSLVDPEAIADSTKSQNAALERLAESIPDRMSYKQLDKLIRDLRAPVRARVGAIDVPVPVAQRKAILSAAADYRDALLPGAAPEFAKAERYLDAVKGLHKRLFDTKGNLRDQAPRIWRNSFGNPRVQESLRKFDEQTAGKYNAVERGRALARKAFWNPDDGDTAEGLLLASVGWWGRASLFAGRGVGKVAIFASRPIGAAAAAGASMAQEKDLPSP